MIVTALARLRRWQERHRDAFAALHADPSVMADYGGPLDRVASDAKFERYRAAEREHGTARFAVEAEDGALLGYAGVMPRMDPAHPRGCHFEVGWRFFPTAWGRGIATECARASLRHAVREVGLRRIIAYTAPDNLRSQAVMARLALARAPELDFVAPDARGTPWHGLVWSVPVDAFA